MITRGWIDDTKEACYLSPCSGPNNDECGKRNNCTPTWAITGTGTPPEEVQMWADNVGTLYHKQVGRYPRHPRTVLLLPEPSTEGD